MANLADNVRLNADVNKLRFANICYKHNISALNEGSSVASIGILNEKRIHAVLKEYFEPQSKYHEVPFLGYVADVKNASGIIEIQTGSLYPLKAKLSSFLEESNVTLVHPVASVKYLSWIDPVTGDISPRRKSPKKNPVVSSLVDLYYIRQFLAQPRLMIRLVLLEVDEYRYKNGWSRDGKRGSTRYERIPLDLIDIIPLDVPADYLYFLPDTLKNSNEFTVRDFSEATKISRHDAYMVLTTMTAAGAIKKEKRRGNVDVYTVIA